MTACGRSCCWTPYSCGTAYSCACHWDDRKPAPTGDMAGKQRDPTANQAIRNVMKANRK